MACQIITWITQLLGLIGFMVVNHRAHGFRIVIYTADYDPAHIHITGAGQVKVNLSGPRRD